VLAHASLQRHASDAVIGRLAAFDELLVTISMVVSAFAGAAAVTTFGLGAAPVTGVALSLAGVAAARILVVRTARIRTSLAAARIRT
jgi:hypothetical protein